MTEILIELINKREKFKITEFLFIYFYLFVHECTGEHVHTCTYVCMSGGQLLVLASGMSCDSFEIGVSRWPGAH